MTAGRLNRRVTLRLNLPGTADAYGQPPEEANDYGPVWACVEPGAGSEPVVAGGVQPQGVYTVTIRRVDETSFLDGRRLTSDWQVIWSRGDNPERVLEILSSALDEDEVWQTLLCREKVSVPAT